MLTFADIIPLELPRELVLKLLLFLSLKSFIGISNDPLGELILINFLPYFLCYNFFSRNSLSVFAFKPFKFNLFLLKSSIFLFLYFLGVKIGVDFNMGEVTFLN